MRYGRVFANYPVNDEFEEQLSKPFYFRQKEHGTIVDVLFPKATESPEVAAFKKGKIVNLLRQKSHLPAFSVRYNRVLKVISRNSWNESANVNTQQLLYPTTYIADTY